MLRAGVRLMVVEVDVEIKVYIMVEVDRKVYVVAVQQVAPDI